MYELIFVGCGHFCFYGIIMTDYKIHEKISKIFFRDKNVIIKIKI